MEIALLPKSSLRIKGKRASFIVDPQDKDKQSHNAVIVLTRAIKELNLSDDEVVIQGPGEYEIGGVKMNVSRIEGNMIYNPIVDGVDIVLGKLTAFEKIQHKLKEQNIVVVYVDAQINASFITSLASNVIIFYGDQAKQLTDTFLNGNVTSMPKYSATLDKLPQEVVTVILE